GRAGAARMLLGAQVALSILLLAGAGLFAGSLLRLWSLNPGFNPDKLLLISVDTNKKAEKGAALSALYSRMLQRVAGYTGVRSVSLVMMTPLSQNQWDDDVFLLTAPDMRADMRDTYFNLVGPHYFRTMGTPILAGRDFTEADEGSGEKAAIVTQNAARAWFGSGNPLGQKIRFENAVARIVGVAADAKYLNLREPSPRTLY